jgi:16S rRNA (guanine1516-N2)-methyltransferase
MITEIRAESQTVPSGFSLQDEDGVLVLRDESQHLGRLSVDFIQGKLAWRRVHGGGVSQPLAKAVGLKSGKRPSVLDATMGLAQDAFVLAMLGCEVDGYERCWPLAQLVQDGLNRAVEDAELGAVITRLRCHAEDAIGVMKSHVRCHDVVYLDPMYPGKKKTAKVKKGLQFIRRLVGETADEALLLAVSRAYASKRVVVKRPLSAPSLAGESPSFVIRSVKTRFDVYLC